MEDKPVDLETNPWRATVDDQHVRLDESTEYVLSTRTTLLRA